MNLSFKVFDVKLAQIVPDQLQLVAEKNCVSSLNTEKPPLCTHLVSRPLQSSPAGHSSELNLIY
jgi:hypothetical protein